MNKENDKRLDDIRGALETVIEWAQRGVSEQIDRMEAIPDAYTHEQRMDFEQAKARVARSVERIHAYLSRLEETAHTEEVM